MDAQEHRARHIAHNEGKNYNKLTKAEKDKCLCKAEAEETPVGLIIPTPIEGKSLEETETIAREIIEISKVKDADSDSGTGQPDFTTGSPDTSESAKPAKPKAKRATRKRAKKIL